MGHQMSCVVCAKLGASALPIMHAAVRHRTCLEASPVRLRSASWATLIMPEVTLLSWVMFSLSTGRCNHVSCSTVNPFGALGFLPAAAGPSSSKVRFTPFFLLPCSHTNA